MGDDYLYVMAVLILLNCTLRLLGEYRNSLTFPVIVAILLAAALIGIAL